MHIGLVAIGVPKTGGSVLEASSPGDGISASVESKGFASAVMGVDKFGSFSGTTSDAEDKLSISESESESDADVLECDAEDDL